MLIDFKDLSAAEFWEIINEGDQIVHLPNKNVPIQGFIRDISRLGDLTDFSFSIPGATNIAFQIENSDSFFGRLIIGRYLMPALTDQKGNAFLIMPQQKS